MEAYTVRDAAARDIDQLVSIVDPIASAGDEDRISTIGRWVENGSTRVVEVGQQVVGYCVLEYTFFDQGFITMLAVAEQARRSGIGAALVRDAECRCRSVRLFTSTNLSNRTMQRLLRRLHWESAGVVYGLDDGDPELFFRAPARARTVGPPARGRSAAGSPPGAARPMLAPPAGANCAGAGAR